MSTPDSGRCPLLVNPDDPDSTCVRWPGHVGACSEDEDEDEGPDEPPFLLWMDLETTGLEPDKHLILEASYQATTFRHPYAPLTRQRTVLTLADDFDVDQAYEKADAHVRKMHTTSGLWADLKLGRNSYDEPAITARLLERDLLQLSANWPTKRSRRVMLAGNTVHFDLGFLRAHLPKFAARLHFRVFDASGARTFLRSLGMPRGEHENPHRADRDMLAARELAHLCAQWIREGETSMTPIVGRGSE